VSTKAVGLLADLLSPEEWEAFYLATGQGWFSAVIVVTSEALEKLKAGKGEVLLMDKARLVIALMPAAAIVSAYEKKGEA
jgi:hypothetical protein